MEICYNGVWGTVCDYDWDQVDANVVCQQLGFSYQGAISTSNSHFGAGEGPVLLENVRCNQSHSNLSQCVDLRHNIGILSDCEHTAGVICHCVGEDKSTSTELVLTTMLYSTTINIMSHNSTNKSYDTTPTASIGSGSLTLPILGTMGTLLIIGAIAAIAIVIIVVVVRKRMRQTENG